MPSYCAEYYRNGRHFKVSETQTVSDCTAFYAVTYSEMQPIEQNLTTPSYISCNQIHSSGAHFAFGRIDYNSFSECIAANEFIILPVATYNALVAYEPVEPQPSLTLESATAHTSFGVGFLFIVTIAAAAYKVRVAKSLVGKV